MTSILVWRRRCVGASAVYNFRLVGLDNIYSFRDEIEFPAWLRYAIGATSNALLPFAFACFLARGKRWRAAATLLLMLFFYPITLTKLALFAPFWLLFLALLSSFFEARTSVVLSLFLPLLAGISLAVPVEAGAFPFQRIMNYFGPINFRMIAFPSVALDVYNDFFCARAHTCFLPDFLLGNHSSAVIQWEYLSIHISIEGLPTRQSECLPVCHRRHCFGRTDPGAARRARVRAGDIFL